MTALHRNNPLLRLILFFLKITQYASACLWIREMIQTRGLLERTVPIILCYKCSDDWINIPYCSVRCYNFNIFFKKTSCSYFRLIYIDNRMTAVF